MKTSKLELKTRDALRKQSNVATLNFASLITRRQQVASTKKSVVGGGGLKGVGSDFASACSCEHGEAKLSPTPPLTTREKTTSNGCFLRKEAWLATPNLTNLNLAFSRYGSRRVKFVNLLPFKTTDLSKNQPNLINIARSKQKSG